MPGLHSGAATGPEASMKIRDVTAELLAWPKHEPEFWMSLVPV